MSRREQRLSAAVDPLFRAAQLLLPAHAQEGEVIAPRGFRVPAPRTDACVYVYPPTTDGTLHAIASIASRERLLGQLRASPPAGYRIAGIHRVPPTTLGTGPRAALGRTVRAGLLIELHRTSGTTRVIDEIFTETGARPPMRFTSGGGILADYGPDHVLRAAIDPTESSEALLALLGHPHVPKLVAWGTIAGAMWSIESKLHGHRPRHVGRELALDIASFCASLPRSEHPPTAPWSDLAELRFALPERETLWTLVEQRLDAVLPDISVARHGDLWIGNVLAVHGRLTGVVDWDAWHPQTTPGADLLHAYAFEGSVSLGRCVASRPWASEDFRAMSQLYWQSLGLPLRDDLLEAAGLSWWIGHLATTIGRDPALAADPRWAEENIDIAAGAFLQAAA